MLLRATHRAVLPVVSLVNTRRSSFAASPLRHTFHAAGLLDLHASSLFDVGWLVAVVDAQEGPFCPVNGLAGFRFWGRLGSYEVSRKAGPHPSRRGGARGAVVVRKEDKAGAAECSNVQARLAYVSDGMPELVRNEIVWL